MILTNAVADLVSTETVLIKLIRSAAVAMQATKEHFAIVCDVTVAL